MTAAGPPRLRFSLSTPVGAYHSLLPASLESLRRQTEPMDLAFLDASGDPRVRGLADAYRDIIRYRRHGPDGGQAAAISEGWAQSDADILGWLNADDVLYPEALRTVARVFEAHPEADVVYGHSAICDEHLRMTGYHWAVSAPGPALRLGCNISQPSCFFRRRAFDAAGGLDGTLHYTMDWDLWLRLEAQGSRFLFIDDPLSAVFWGKGTKTSGFNRARRQELSRLIQRYTPTSDQRRVFRGFATQALLDRVPAASIRRTIRETLLPNRRQIFGVGPDGRLDGSATIKWFHLGPAPCESLRLELQGAVGLECTSTRALRHVSVLSDEVVLRFAEPVDPATTVTIRLQTAPGQMARFHVCAWNR